MTAIPGFLAHLPVFARLPVPYFTLIEDGVPNFRAHEPRAHRRAIMERLCGVCGKRLSWWLWSVVGPNELTQGATFMPAMHEPCMRYALSVCPFLAVQDRVARGSGRHQVPTAVVPTAVVKPKPQRLALIRYRHYQVLQASRAIGTEYVRFETPKETTWLVYAAGQLTPESDVT